MESRKRYALFAWAVLFFNIAVILWGAWVRISYSGDGCGAHWPFCGGVTVPKNMSRATVIEFTHRVMTGVDVIAVISLLVFAFVIYPKRHIVRRYATWSFLFLIIESLLGAALVLFRMVAHSQSAGRGWSLSAHLLNTMLMLGAMTLTAWLASGGRESFRIWDARNGLLWSAAITLFISVTGAVTALGDTLFPAGTLMQGVHQDLASDSPMILRLRIAHPAIAVVGTIFVIWTVLEFWRHSPAGEPRKASMRFLWLCILQLFMGAINLSLLAPVWAQIAHLLIGDFAWIAMVLVLAESVVAEQLPFTTPLGVSGRQTAAGKPA